MSIKEPPFTIGLEEEYLLVDRETRALAVNPPEAILTESAKSWGAGPVLTSRSRNMTGSAAVVRIMKPQYMPLLIYW